MNVIPKYERRTPLGAKEQPASSSLVKKGGRPRKISGSAQPVRCARAYRAVPKIVARRERPATPLKSKNLLQRPKLIKTIITLLLAGEK